VKTGDFPHRPDYRAALTYPAVHDNISKADLAVSNANIII